MVKWVLPLMRQQKQGHIINVSSLSGMSSIPFMGMYSASKFALEGYTEALRLEVSPFNIDVSLTEAGFLKTPMMNKRQVSAAQLKEYDLWRQRAFTPFVIKNRRLPMRSWYRKRSSASSRVKKPRLRYLIGVQAKVATRLQRFVPEAAYEWGKMVKRFWEKANATPVKPGSAILDAQWLRQLCHDACADDVGFGYRSSRT